MGHPRRLMSEEPCKTICYITKCSPACGHFCINSCSIDSFPPSPPFIIDVIEPAHNSSKTHHKISTALIITLTLLSAAFFLFCCYALYVKFLSARLGSRRRSQPQTEETLDDFLDEEHGPVVDHPIWYIRTPGLQESIITAITVCKYKRGEGLIEGTECSVCLSEFEEDEALRLLPKCNHAFHLPCIDTWLRSHTNCPMCRAPIVTNTARTPSEDPNPVDSSSMGNTQMEIVIDNGENSARIESSVPELRVGEEEEAQLESTEEDSRRVFEGGSSSAEGEDLQPRRRSISLDSSFAAKINLALATFRPAEGSSGNSSGQLGQVNGAIVSKRITKGSSSFRARYLQSAPTTMKRSRSFNGKHLLSWYNRSHKKPNAPIRSF
ncbi:hypothetical protein L6164_032612 [Bauhinia variegata]|uniref:Uncharacterized protein n=1 Tax=Bauhinia variegata TaxID=167791 RepID=A0ACB9KP55_BAUVA|nr:hypothetical protein L6164_032612 [Bauhinia variegata]